MDAKTGVPPTACGDTLTNLRVRSRKRTGSGVAQNLLRPDPEFTARQSGNAHRKGDLASTAHLVYRVAPLA